MAQNASVVETKPAESQIEGRDLFARNGTRGLKGIDRGTSVPVTSEAIARMAEVSSLNGKGHVLASLASQAKVYRRRSGAQ